MSEKRGRIEIAATARTSMGVALLTLQLLAFGVTSLPAQDSPRRLTLAEAIDLARTNNPTFLSQRNDQGPADWEVREAYAAFLPGANASGGFAHTDAGVQRLGTGVDFIQNTDWFSSSYSLNVGWSLNGSTLFGIPSARAHRRGRVHSGFAGDPPVHDHSTGPGRRRGCDEAARSRPA